MMADITYLAGVSQPKAEPLRPFSEPVLDFLEKLSLEIRKNRTEHDKYPEIAAFGFWLRRAHIEEYRLRYEEGRLRIGRGVVFHIVSSNVPVLFAYSMVIGLLAGNSCVIRISSRSREEDRKLCEIIDNLLNQPELSSVRNQISIFSCERDNDVIKRWLEECDGLMVWGGDQTIRSVREMKLRPDAVQVMFPDRYSICILDTKQISMIQEEALQTLAYGFVKDAYAMDQNACSSPQFVIWNQQEETEKAEEIHRRWWNAVRKEAAAYEIDAHKATRKYETLCKYAMIMEEILKTERYGNLLYTVQLSKISPNPERYRGTYGLFFEYQGDYLPAVRQLAVRQLQTVTYYGIRREELTDYIINNHLYGIHRVVPVGEALNMDLVWDGQDLIEMLSREIVWEE
jgi:hypothetical protein